MSRSLALSDTVNPMSEERDTFRHRERANRGKTAELVAIFVFTPPAVVYWI
jgi:hypothetical protein